MKAFTKFWYTPPHQRKDKPEVKFELKPLDQRTLYAMNIDMRDDSVGPDGAFAAFEYAVKNWEGLDVEYSMAAKRALLQGVADFDMSIWIGQIAAHLWAGAFQGEPEIKNS